MKLRYIDWEVEKNKIEDFTGYDKRYYLEEVLKEDGMKVQAKIIIASDKFADISGKIGELAFATAMKKEQIEFVENESLIQFRKFK